MTGPAEKAVAAARALTFTADYETIRFHGDPSLFDLRSESCVFFDFLDGIAPVDRERLERALGGDRIDTRLRLVAADGHVRYARLIGERGPDGIMRGLMTPAGATDIGARGRVDAERELNDGVCAGEIVAHYQPIVALETGRLAGFEALARWDRPGIGIVGPDDFLGLADELDLLGRIGRQVRSDAARDLAVWRAANPQAPLFVAANATVSELLSDGFAEALIADVSASGLRAGTYKLEIAETELMRQPEEAEAVIRDLKAAGIAIALDDFGTGYSSLSRLDRFNFDTVKIDRYFVRALAAAETASKVIESVLQLSRHFGMTVVAEGVEDSETAARLAEMGCDYAQGFRYAGAVDEAAAADLSRHGLDGRFGPPV